MNTVYVQGERKEVISALLIKSLNSIVKSTGEDHLRIKADTVGTYSIKTSLDMFLYINEFYTPTIMLMVRRNSRCFIKYLQTQVKGFSKEVGAHIII